MTRRDWKFLGVLSAVGLLVVLAGGGWLFVVVQRERAGVRRFEESHRLAAVEGKTPEEVEAAWGKPYREL